MKTTEGHIPDKLYFRIGEVSDIVGVKPYVLRYWESEFQDIHPTKSKSGQRLYKRRDVEVLMAIKRLLYEERFTINGARKRLKELVRGGDGHDVPDHLPEDVDVEEHASAPRQLEVFGEDDPGEQDGEEEPMVARTSPDNRKVLLKIKRDLQSLLQELKS